MKPAGAIVPPDWMTASATRRVVAALRQSGQPARFVGGAVRDAVLGRPVTDIDLATPLPPGDAAQLLERAGIKVIPTGLDHGTITAVSESRRFEVTTLRRDVETFGRHARVAYTDDWLADAARRDFTMNALFADEDGTLYDPTGAGLDDLRAGRVRFIGDAGQRIAEDYLRLLRFFRFQAVYGRVPPDDAALAACAAAAPQIATLSRERVWAELKRLLGAADPVPMLRLMAARGVLAHVLPAAADIDPVARLIALERSIGAGPDPLARLAVLLGTDAAVLPTADHLRLSNAEREHLAAVLRAAASAGAPACRLVRRFGRAAAAQGVLAAAAAGGSTDDVAQRWAAVEAWVEVPLPVAGADILALGLPPGPEIGRLLGQIEDWWEAQDCTADRAACLEKLRDLLRARPPS